MQVSGCICLLTWLSFRWSLITVEGVSVQKFTGNVCGAQSQRLVQRVAFGLERVKVSSLEGCHLICFTLQLHPEVSQCEEVAHEIIIGQLSFYCTCSSIPARYFVLFPRRYVECNSDNSNEVRVQFFYRQDRVWTGLPVPLLFYAMDEITQTINLGSLNEGPERANRSVEWLNGSAHYDCSSGIANVPNRLRFEPSEMPWLRVIHNTPQNYISKGFTWLQWFKKRSPDSIKLPFVDGMENAQHAYHWLFWNFPAANDLNAAFGNGLQTTGKFTPTAWNQIAMVVSQTSIVMFVNASQVGSTAVGGQTFGDSLYIARRYYPGEANDGRVFDGCFAHVVLFNKTLSGEEQKKFYSLFADGNF